MLISTRQADIFDQVNRKREWRQHRIDRAVRWLFETWSRYWGRDSEFHGPDEMISILLRQDRNDGFIRALNQESEVTLEEVKEFLSDPISKKAFFEAFQAAIKSHKQNIRNADIFDKISRKPAFYLFEDNRNKKKFYNPKMGELTTDGISSGLPENFHAFNRGKCYVLCDNKRFEDFDGVSVEIESGRVGDIYGIDTSGRLMVRDPDPEVPDFTMDPLEYIFYLSADGNRCVAKDSTVIL